MAHLTDGTLRRMVDDPDARTGAGAVHLESCAECNARFERIASDAGAIARQLAVPETQVDLARALDRVRRAPNAAPALGLRLPLVPPLARPLKLAFVAVVAGVSLAAVAFAANGFFYKPTQVQAVPVTAVDLQALSRLSEYGTFTWVKQPSLSVTTAAPAGAPGVGWLPPGTSTTVTYGTIGDAEATFTFSAAKAAAAAAGHGATAPPMPAGLDGATVTITAGPAVGIVYGEIQPPAGVSDPSQVNLPQLVIVKSAPPTVKSDAVSLDVLESYLLQQPGLTDDLKQAIEGITDPGSTLIVPFPVNYATSTPYTVTGLDGGKGVALGDNTGVGAAVVWISSDGRYLYAVGGSVKVSDAEKIADNLK